MTKESGKRIRRRDALKALSAVGVGGIAGCTGGRGGGSSSGTTGGSSSETGGSTQSGSSSGDAELSLKMGTTATQSNGMYRAAKWLGDTLEERTDGRLQLDVLCCAKAGGDTQMTKGIKTGTLDMALVGTNNIASLTKAWYFAQLPYLWKDANSAMENFWRTDKAKPVTKQAEEDLGLKVAAYWSPGGGSYRQMMVTDSKHKMKVPSDVKGLKIRVTESPVEKTVANAWGFSPTPIPWTDTYQAMQQGVVKGIHLHYFWAFQAGMFELLEYIEEIQSLYSPNAVLMGNETYSQIPDDLTDVFDETVREASEKEFEFDQEQGNKAKQAAKEKGVEIYTPSSSEKKAWQEASVPVYDEWLAKDSISKDTVKTALSAQSHSIPGLNI